MGRRRKGGLTPGADAPTGPTRSGVSMRGTGENIDSGVGLHSTRAAEWAKDYSYPLTIRMEGATEG